MLGLQRIEVAAAKQTVINVNNRTYSNIYVLSKMCS